MNELTYGKNRLCECSEKHKDVLHYIYSYLCRSDLQLLEESQPSVQSRVISEFGLTNRRGRKHLQVLGNEPHKRGKEKWTGVCHTPSDNHDFRRPEKNRVDNSLPESLGKSLPNFRFHTRLRIRAIQLLKSRTGSIKFPCSVLTRTMMNLAL